MVCPHIRDCGSSFLPICRRIKKRYYTGKQAEHTVACVFFTVHRSFDIPVDVEHTRCPCRLLIHRNAVYSVRRSDNADTNGIVLGRASTPQTHQQPLVDFHPREKNKRIGGKKQAKEYRKLVGNWLTTAMTATCSVGYRISDISALRSIRYLSTKQKKSIRLRYLIPPVEAFV